MRVREIANGLDGVHALYAGDPALMPIITGSSESRVHLSCQVWFTTIPNSHKKF